MGKNETEIEIVLKKKDRLFIHNVKAIPGEFQHAFVVVDIGKKKIRNVARDTH